jgi:hypothetical protein
MRQPLGLPAGSVRALLALMVFGIVWALLLLPELRPDLKPVRIPLYLYYLMFLILGNYFAVRSHRHPGMPAEAPPLHLPRGMLRFLFLAGFVAVLGWGFYHDPNFADHLTPPVGDQPLLVVIVLGAFFLGIIVGRVGSALFSGANGVSPWFQDLFAWVSLLAVIGLAVEVLIRLVINPTVSRERQLNLPHWESFLAGIVAFYYGARS